MGRVSRYIYNSVDAGTGLEVNKVSTIYHLNKRSYHFSPESDPMQMSNETNFNSGIHRVNSDRTKIDRCRNGVNLINEIYY